MADIKISALPAAGTLSGIEIVPIVDGGVTQRTTTADIAALSAAPAGVPVVRKFPFAFDTPNILTGATLYTPTIGDILLDAWIEVDTAWNGTTPRGDIGTFISNSSGWFNNWNPLDMSLADSDIYGTDGLLQGNTPGLASMTAVFATQNGLALDAIPPTSTRLNEFGATFFGIRTVSKFTAANPIKVVVSQTGHNDGADPGSTQGAAILYLVTVTPV